MDITTIKITKKTKERLEHLRIYRRESYEEILEKILGVLNVCRVDPEQARMKLLQIDKERKRNLGNGSKEDLSEEENYQESQTPGKPRFHLRK
ncbi:MAG: hypothetical protein AABY00_01105 [Nanoarchaeota archaeon]